MPQQSRRERLLINMFELVCQLAFVDPLQVGLQMLIRKRRHVVLQGAEGTGYRFRPDAESGGQTKRTAAVPLGCSISGFSDIGATSSGPQSRHLKQK